MNSSMNSIRQPIADEAGVTAPIIPAADPYQALDDLMAVVEALCPSWQARRIFTGTETMLL